MSKIQMKTPLVEMDGARIDDKTETTQNDFFSTNNFQQHKIDEKTALGYYSLWELAKNHIIFLLVFFNTFKYSERSIKRWTNSSNVRPALTLNQFCTPSAQYSHTSVAA